MYKCQLLLHYKYLYFDFPSVVLSMADGFDPASEFAVGTVHWADEDEAPTGDSNSTNTTRKRTRSKSITPAPEERPSKKYKSIVKETLGVTKEDWTNLHPTLQRHIAHNQGGDHHLTSQVTMDCEHNHQSTVTADMTNHMLDTWAKKGVDLNEETQKTFILCNQAKYRQGMVVSARPKDQKDWHYIVYEFDPPLHKQQMQSTQHSGTSSNTLQMGCSMSQHKESHYVHRQPPYTKESSSMHTMIPHKQKNCTNNMWLYPTKSKRRRPRNHNQAPHNLNPPSYQR